MRWSSIPACRIGTMNTVRPRCFGTSQFDRAKQSAQSDHQAPLVQIFGAVENPFFTVADSRRHGTGDVGTAAGLREELGPDLVATKDARQMFPFLLFGAELKMTGAHCEIEGLWRWAG